MTDFAGSGSRRVFAERILREVRSIVATASTGSLTTSITALPLAASVVATDRFPLVTSAGVGYRATATLIRDYVLAISGGTATIAENLSVGGNTTLGNLATADTITATARFASVLTPSTNNARDLGEATLTWRTGYFGTRVGIGIGTTLSTDVNLDVASGFGVRPSSSVAYPTVLNGGFAGRFYAIHEAGDWGFVIGRAVNDTLPANLTFYKTRSATGARTVVQNGDYIARLTFQGVSQSSGTVTIGAAILAQVNGAVSDGVMPTDLLFATVATGDATAANSKWMLQSAGHWTPYTGNDNAFDVGNVALRPRTVHAGTSVIAPLVNGTTRITSPLLGTTSDVDVVLDRNSVTQLTLGSLAATFAGTATATEFLAPSIDSGSATDLLLQRNNVTQLTLGSSAATFVGTVAGTAFSGTTWTGTGLIKTTLTSQQLQLNYDADTRLDVTVASTGRTTLDTGSADGQLVVRGASSGSPLAIITGVINETGLFFVGAGSSGIILQNKTGSAANDALSIRSGIIINDEGEAVDSRMEGDTDANLFYLDASTDRIGIGTASPGYLFDVNGVVNAATEYRVAGTKVVGAQGAALTDPTGGVVIDAESRTAIADINARMRASTGHGLVSG